MEKDLDTVVIVYPNMRYDIESVLDVVDNWTCDNVIIYVIEDFDIDYGRDDFKPYGMPHTLEKVKIVLHNKLTALGAIIEPEESDDSDEELDEYVECWTLKFSFITEGKRAKDRRTRSFTLVHFYDIDAFGDDWPEMEKANVLIHTNGPLDPELVRDMLPESDKTDVYATPEMLKYTWRVLDETPVDEHEDLSYFGTLDEYISESDEESDE